MPTQEENLKLVWSIVKQLAPEGKNSGIDFNKVKEDLGIESTGAASKRWARLKAQLEKGDFSGGAGKGGGAGAGAGSGDAASTAPRAVKAKKPANPKAKKEDTPAKKRKVEEIEAGEEEDLKDIEDGDNFEA